MLSELERTAGMTARKGYPTKCTDASMAKHSNESQGTTVTGLESVSHGLVNAGRRRVFGILADEVETRHPSDG